MKTLDPEEDELLALLEPWRQERQQMVGRRRRRLELAGKVGGIPTATDQLVSCAS